MAIATPEILPRPTVAASTALRAWKREIPGCAFSLLSNSEKALFNFPKGCAFDWTTKYKPPELSDQHAALNNREAKFTHLTNYSLNKLNKKGFKKGNGEDGEDGILGSKWSLKAFRKVLRSNGIDDKAIFKKIYDVINKTFLSVDPVLR